MSVCLHLKTRTPVGSLGSGEDGEVSKNYLSVQEESLKDKLRGPGKISLIGVVTEICLSIKGEDGGKLYRRVKV